MTGLKCPGGVYIAAHGLLYVANTCDHTVKVYNSPASTLVATMGVSGVPGSDNAHFNSPEDVAVDAAGTIYVSDQNNHRVQVFNSSRVYVRTIGADRRLRRGFRRISACPMDWLWIVQIACTWSMLGITVSRSSIPAAPT